MEIKWKDYQMGENLLNFSIKSKEFNGIISTEKEKVIDLLFLKNKYKGKIIFLNTF